MMFFQVDDTPPPPLNEWMAAASKGAKELSLFEHQRRARDLIRASARKGMRRIVLQSATGSGKTILMIAMILDALRKGKKIIIVVPNLQLIDQTLEKLAEYGICDVGVVQAQHHLTNYGKQVTVCSTQTLERRYAKGQMLPTADLVFIDECHRHFMFYETWMADPAWAKAWFIGLSATPWRKGLGNHWQDLQIAATTRELIDAGLLCDFRVYASSHPDLSGIKDVAGDYHEGQLSERMQGKKLVADAVEAYQRHGKGEPGLVYGVDCPHAQKLCDEFNEAGIPAGYIDHKTPPAEREKIKLAHKHGRLKVVVNVATLCEGIDWPWVSVISLCRPTKSAMLFVQIVGRGLRKHLGKLILTLLDHSDTTERLGFVDEIDQRMSKHGLCDGTDRVAKARKREKQERLTECLSCGAVRRPQQKVCWSCGYEGKRQTKIVHADGKLKELTRGKQLKFSMEDKQRFWSGALHWGYQRGKSRDTMAGYYKRHFGVWPKGLREIAMEDPETSAHCTKSAQDFARRKSYGSRRNTPANAGVSP